MMAKCWNCLVVITASMCLVLYQAETAQAATIPGSAKWNPIPAFATTDQVTGSPIISPNGQRIYITSGGPAVLGPGSGKLYSINASSGQNSQDNWSVELHNTRGYNAELISSPVVDNNGFIYVAATGGELYKIDPTTKDVDTPNHWPFQVPVSITGTPGAVALAPDGTIYVTYDDDTKLYAVNPSGPSGPSLKWVFDAVGCANVGLIDSAPAVGPDGTVYFWGSGADTGSYLVAVDCGGNFKWNKELFFDEFANGVEVNDFQCTPVVDSSGIVYVPFGSAADNILALNPDGTPKLGFPFSAGGTIHSSPAIGSDGTLYFGSDDGHLYAITSGGSLKWKYPPTGQQALDKIISSPALGSDGTIYFGCNDGRMRSISDIGASGATLQWTFPPSGQLGAIRSSPVIGSDNNGVNTVYFGADDFKVYAVYDSAPLANSTWPMFRRNASHTASQATGTACSSPYWLTPHDGDTLSVSPCECVLLKVNAAAGTQIKFWDLDTTPFPANLNTGTAGADNTYSWLWCDPANGTHHLFFEASANGSTISSACQPITLTLNTTAPFDSINVQFSGDEYVGTVGPAAVQFAIPENHFSDQWNVFHGLNGSSAEGNHVLFDANGNGTPTILAVFGGTPTYTLTQSPANAANCGMLRGGMTADAANQTWVEVANVPSGTYDLYLYGTGGTIDIGSGPQTWNCKFEIYHPWQVETMDPKTTSSGIGYDFNTWAEGNQYVVFRGIQMDQCDYIIIILEPDDAFSPYVPPIINGLQLVKTPY